VNYAKHRADISGLSQVTCYFPSFTDVRGRMTRCDFLDLGDGVGFVGCDFHSVECNTHFFTRIKFCPHRSAYKMHINL
jgi:hypothetical protein